jgi:hypothetical protein
MATKEEQQWLAQIHVDGTVASQGQPYIKHLASSLLMLLRLKDAQVDLSARFVTERVRSRG